jgi:hypothetical protein
MTLRKLVLTIEQALFNVALHLGVVVHCMPQLSKRFREFGFDLALKDFSLQWEGEGRAVCMLASKFLGEQKRGGECLAVHFSQRGFAHLLLGVALPRSRVEHSTLLELFTRILNAITCDNLIGAEGGMD